MQLSIILVTLLNHFTTSPDLCAEPYLGVTGEPFTDSIGQTLSRYCQWTGPNVPVLDSDVCCVLDEDSAACTLPNRYGRCSVGVKRYCKYGQASSAGVVCYQPFQDACQAGFCVQMPEVPPPVQADLACCNGGGCVPIATQELDECEETGTITWCSDGVTNDDGTITCFDP
jgi:hypothetical protein